MGTLISKYREAIETVLQDYANFLGQSDGIQQELVFDRDNDRYLLVEAGWQNNKRVYGPFIHLDIIDGKIWIQHDGTEEGIAYDLEAAGIVKESIVLAFKSPERRKLTGYAIA